jgi:hypothetical protein
LMSSLQVWLRLRVAIYQCLDGDSEFVKDEAAPGRRTGSLQA